MHYLKKERKFYIGVPVVIRERYSHPLLCFGSSTGCPNKHVPCFLGHPVALGHLFLGTIFGVSNWSKLRERLRYYLHFKAFRSYICIYLFIHILSIAGQFGQYIYIKIIPSCIYGMEWWTEFAQICRGKWNLWVPGGWWHKLKNSFFKVRIFSKV